MKRKAKNLESLGSNKKKTIAKNLESLGSNKKKTIWNECRVKTEAINLQPA